MLMSGRPLSLAIAAPVAIVFGVLTLVSGGRALFGGAEMGAVVPFVLWFNFCAGFFYILAGVGLWRGAAWGLWLAVALTMATGVVFAAFLSHVLRGGAFEMRTMGAMSLRLAVWAAISVLALRSVPR